MATKRSSGSKRKAGKTPKLGSGGRFKAVAASAAKSGARDPNAVAAAVGRKKYGSKKMTALSTAGRKHRGKKKR